MPIYKAKGIKDGLQKYSVRINYISDSGEAKQLTRIAYGSNHAKDLERQLNQDLKNKEIILAKKMTVQELVNEYMAMKAYELRKSSFIKLQHNFNHYILPSFKTHFIDKITVSAVQDWKILMAEKNYALQTKKKAFICFNALLKYATTMEYLQKNPLEKVGNFKDTLNIKQEMKFYVPEEFKKYITVAKEYAEEKEKSQNDLSEWNYYVFFSIAFYTGLRKGEILALKWSDISGSYLTVSRSITQKVKGGDIETAPKNRASIRTIQMPLPLIRILEEQKQRQKILHNFTDDFRICGKARDTTLQIKNKKYSIKANVPTIRIHDFRHSHASLLANENINIQEVARRLGHSRIEMTWNTYSHLYPREEEKAVAILNNFA